jgi:hypothetical protein
VLIVKETAHHMFDAEAFFAELARVVRSDGILVVVEGVQCVLVNRERALARDRMRQLGATHHHFYLWDITRPLKRMFRETRVAHAVPTLFGSAFARVRLARLGTWMDHFLAQFPLFVRLGALVIGGGTVILTCRRPTVDGSLADPAETHMTPVVAYPVELAEVAPMSETVIKGIQNILLGGTS